MDKNQKIIGERLREIRTTKGMTINHVAKETGFTPSFISQLERGLTKASVASLQKITKVLEVNLSAFFQENTSDNLPNQDQQPVVVRESERRNFTYPDNKSSDYLLTGLKGRFEVISSKIEPYGESGELFTHDPAEECIVVLEGQLEVTVGEEKYLLYKGDTITFSSRIPHGWRNTGTETSELIWIVSPPNY